MRKNMYKDVKTIVKSVCFFSLNIFELVFRYVDLVLHAIQSKKRNGKPNTYSILRSSKQADKTLYLGISHFLKIISIFCGKAYRSRRHAAVLRQLYRLYPLYAPYVVIFRVLGTFLISSSRQISLPRRRFCTVCTKIYVTLKPLSRNMIPLHLLNLLRKGTKTRRKKPVSQSYENYFQNI